MSYENYGSETGGQPDYLSPEPYGSEPSVPLGWDRAQLQQQTAIGFDIWRDMERRAAQAASAGYQAPVLPPETFTATPGTLPNNTPVTPTSSDSGYPQLGRHRRPVSPDERQRAQPQSVPQPERPQPRNTNGNGALKVAGVLLSAVTLFGGYNYLQTDHKDSTPTAATSDTDHGSSCNFTRIDEKDGQGLIEFKSPTSEQEVQIFSVDDTGTHTGLKNATKAPDQPGVYTYNAANFHSQRLVVTVDGAECASSFTLGSPVTGDEKFLPN